jgi:hypothetical protein
LKSNQGWALVEGSGKRDFVPPGDPRHPHQANGPVVREQESDREAPDNGSATPPEAHAGTCATRFAGNQPISEGFDSQPSRSVRCVD